MSAWPQWYPCPKCKDGNTSTNYVSYKCPTHGYFVVYDKDLR